MLEIVGVLLIAVVHMVGCKGQDGDMTRLEKTLFQNLTTGYNPSSRPVTKATEKVHMSFGLGLNQIIDLDEKHQILSSYVWIYERWKDANLVWQPEEYQGLDKLMFPATTIWLPDIYIFNVAGSNLEGFVNVTGSKVLVLHDGQVTWSIPLHIKSACPVDATFFPYDKQSCDVHFGSWIYDISQMDITLDTGTADISNYVVNNEFDLYKTELKRDIVNNSCCPGEGKHPMVHFKMLLKRKTNYYDYIVIAPTINLCVLTLATFLLPCECGWKIAIGLTVFLNLYVLQLLIAENVPDTNSTPLISVFLLLVMSLNSVSLIMATFIMNIKRRSLEDPTPRVPPLLLHICEKYLSKIVCTSMSQWKRIADTPNYIEEHVTIFHPRDDIYETDDNDIKNAENYLFQLQNMTSQLQDNTSVTSNDSTDKQISEISMEPGGGAKGTLERTETAESSFSFSCASTSDLYNNHDNSYSDCLLRKTVQSNMRKSENYYTFENDISDSCGVTSSTDESNFRNNVIALNRQRYKFSRHRPSYRKAIKSGHTVVTRKLAPKRKLRKTQSVMSSVSWKYQWYFVADVIDTTTFYIYSIVMLVGIVTVLVITPMYA